MSSAKTAVGRVHVEGIDELEKLAGTTKKPSVFFEQVFQTVAKSSTFDAQTILARMMWLLNNHGGTGNSQILDVDAQATVEEVTHHILYPKTVVLEYIAKHSPLSSAELEEIYNCIRGRNGKRIKTHIDDLTEERVLQEMKWWIADIGFPDYYFDTTPSAEIAQQIVLNRSYEVQGTESESYENLKISYESPSGTSIHWVHKKQKSLEIERQIENDYYRHHQDLDIAVYAHQSLYLYLVQKNTPSANGTSFEDFAPKSFLDRVRDITRERYRNLWEKVTRSGSIAVETSVKQETGENRLMLGFPARFITHFLANLSRVMQRNKITITRKYITTFSGEMSTVVCSFYSPQKFTGKIQEELFDVSLYPDNKIATLVEKETISPREAVFADACTEFIHQFITHAEPNLSLLRDRFQNDFELQETLQALQRRMDKDNYPYSMIVDTFFERPDLLKDLFAIFATQFDPVAALSAKEVQEMKEQFKRSLELLPLNHDEAEIFRWGLFFIESISRTNFFLPVKTAVSFRLQPVFLRRNNYSDIPYGVFYIKGRDMMGFHVRFKDIARGGIRIIKSATYDEYLRNADALFEECYNLAFTQNKKNKDIPEGGSKGVILLDITRNNSAGGEIAFKRYVDALLDILLPCNEKHICDYEEEILFLGPDEGSAELMDWACERARMREYRYWKGFTTGKHARLGGVSHIDYGMTTNSVHQYVLGILEKLDIEEATVIKAQTGGPDGDLGSNEILISRDKTTVIIDGGGVLYDPHGLDRNELARLAQQRLDSSSFDRAKLSPDGFKVTVHDKNVTLPDGSLVVSGLSFRNGFHLNSRMAADLFVPCGGRPKSINGTNWQSLLDGGGKPIFKWIVEGANLFITPDARLRLEEKGVVLFKDSSTNKGGVTSSSLEVLAGLALSDEEFSEKMMEKDGVIPEFRKRYIEEILTIIRQKAKAEFEILWNLNSKTGEAISSLSDSLSAKINEITIAVENSNLFEDESLRRNVLSLHIPEVLCQDIGLETLLRRIPENYQKAIFCRTLASSFIYRHGINPGYEDYRQYVEELRRSSLSLPEKGLVA